MKRPRIARAGAPASPRLLRTGAFVATIATCSLLVVVTAADAASPGRVAETASHRSVVCQHKRGRTILRRGVVRVFKRQGTVYGCVNGSKRAWSLWETQNYLTQSKGGAVKQVAGPYVAVAASTNNQYGFEQSLAVSNLRTGASYAVASVAGELSGVTSGEPATPGPWPLETFVLGPDGRTARLYDTFAPPPNANTAAPVTGQVIDLIGFHRFRRQLATSAPGGIARASLGYDGRTVAWTQNGTPQSASV
jgi:hypothetical protein